MLQSIFLFLLFYVLYKFVFGFVIPVLSATRSVQAKMKDMHEHMNTFNEAETTTQKRTYSSNDSVAKGDYIDFEEIKN